MIFQDVFCTVLGVIHSAGMMFNYLKWYYSSPWMLIWCETYDFHFVEFHGCQLLHVERGLSVIFLFLMSRICWLRRLYYFCIVPSHRWWQFLQLIFERFSICTLYLIFVYRFSIVFLALVLILSCVMQEFLCSRSDKRGM